MIVCCGEALIDFVPLPQGNGYEPCPGGSIFNTAVGLGRLQTPVGFFCQVSSDFFGDQLLAYLRVNGVDTALCPRNPGPTTLAFVSLPAEGAEVRYQFYANGAADRLLTAVDLPELAAEINALHFGSISLVLEPGATALETLMRRESGRRILSLDPNVRPGLIADKEAYRARFEEWVGLVDIVKLSDADFEFLYPEQEPVQVIARWFELGICLCIFTRGARGADGTTSTGAKAAVAAPPVTVVDTVGAGDTFLAAALAFLQQRGWLDSRAHLRTLPAGELAACLAYAARAAAINCSRKGANPPTLAEMEQTYE